MQVIPQMQTQHQGPKILISIQAGKMLRDGQSLTPEPEQRRGTIEIIENGRQRTFKWKLRPSGEVIDTVAIIPDKTTFRQIPAGDSTFALQVKTPEGSHFYWIQEPNTTKEKFTRMIEQMQALSTTPVQAPGASTSMSGANLNLSSLIQNLQQATPATQNTQPAEAQHYPLPRSQAPPHVFRLPNGQSLVVGQHENLFDKPELAIYQAQLNQIRARESPNLVRPEFLAQMRNRNRPDIKRLAKRTIEDCPPISAFFRQANIKHLLDDEAFISKILPHLPPSMQSKAGAEKVLSCSAFKYQVSQLETVASSLAPAVLARQLTITTPQTSPRPSLFPNDIASYLSTMDNGTPAFIDCLNSINTQPLAPEHPDIVADDVDDSELPRSTEEQFDVSLPIAVRNKRKKGIVSKAKKRAKPAQNKEAKRRTPE